MERTITIAGYGEVGIYGVDVLRDFNDCAVGWKYYLVDGNPVKREGKAVEVLEIRFTQDQDGIPELPHGHSVEHAPNVLILRSPSEPYPSSGPERDEWQRQWKTFVEFDNGTGTITEYPTFRTRTAEEDETVLVLRRGQEASAPGTPQKVKGAGPGRRRKEEDEPLLQRLCAAWKTGRYRTYSELKNDAFPRVSLGRIETLIKRQNARDRRARKAERKRVEETRQ